MEDKFLFKVQYEKIKKWCKIDYENLSYENIIKLVQQKFPTLANEDFTLMDIDNTEVDASFIEDFFLMTRKHEEIILKVNSRNQLDNDSNSFTLTDTLTNSSVFEPQQIYTVPCWNNNLQKEVYSPKPIIDDGDIITLDYNTLTESQPLATCSSTSIPTLKKFGDNVLLDDLKQQIITRQSGHHENMFTEYERLQTLTPQSRKILVNVTCDIMMERYGSSIPTIIKEEYADCIIKLFPNLRDTFSPKGYELFFNPKKHDGFLAWRLKNVIKKKKENMKRSSSPYTTADIETNKKSKVEDSIDVESNKAIVEMLKISNPKTETTKIFSKMAETFRYRRSIISKGLLTEFPRFIDTPGLIEQEFSLLYPNKPTLSEIFPTYIDKIFEVFKKIASHKNEMVNPILNDDENAWNLETRALIALAYMLPPTSRGKKSANKDSRGSAIDKLIIFKKTNVPFEDVPKGKQPMLIAEGSSRSNISQYHINVDEQIISLRSETTSLEAFDALFMSYFVFDLNYDQSLQHFWTLVQLLFYNIEENANLTPKIREVRNFLTC